VTQHLHAYAEIEVRLVVGLVIAGGLILGAIGLASLYDYRSRRRGWRVSASTEEAFHNRLDVEAVHNPYLQGGKQDWMTYRQRDRKAPGPDRTYR
jgi:hypothetical protein